MGAIVSLRAFGAGGSFRPMMAAGSGGSRSRSVARLAAAFAVGLLARPPLAASETLQIGAVSACHEESPSQTSPALVVDEVQLSGDRVYDLGSADLPTGWARDGDDTPEIHQTDPCATPLSIEVHSDWVGVTLRSNDLPALVRFGARTRWVEPPDTGAPAKIELGARTPQHAWRAPDFVPYRRSLARSAAVRAGPPSDRGRIHFDERYDLDPYPGLPATRLRPPAVIRFPEVFLPRDGILRFGVAAPRATTLRFETKLEPGEAAPTSHPTVRARPDTLTWVELPLGSSEAKRGSLELRMVAPGGESTPIQIVDPSLFGLEPIGPPRTARPNVILVTLDTVRADHLSIYGYERPTTPFLDEIEDQLLVFNNAYSQVPSTRPSHVSIFTSRYPRDLGIWSNSDPPLPQGELTLAEVLRSAGWRTGAVLSVGFLTADGGAGQGFDEVLVPSQTEQSQLGEHTTERALDFMRRSSEAPFFLWVHYFDAHLPYQTVPELRDLFWKKPVPTDVDIEPDLLVKEGFGTLHALPHRAYMTAMYDASLRYLDDQMRSLFSFLEDRGLLEQTVVVIAADHGESLGEHGVYFAHDGLQEPNVRVPLLLRLPGVRRAGRMDAIVENLDIAPTILEAAGLEVPRSFRGSSLLVEKPGDDEAIFEQGRLFSGIRRGPLKWIDGRGFAARAKFAKSSLRELYARAPLSLFDLESDPTEAANLAADRPEEAERLHERLSSWATEHVDPSRRAEGREIDPAIRDRLRALGYTH